MQELQHAGFHCRPQVVHSRVEFLAQFPRFPYDIVLADSQLANWAGMDALALLREAGRDVPFILIGETLGEEQAVESTMEELTGCVLKTNLAHLPIVVVRALDEKSLRDARAFMLDLLRQSEAQLRHAQKFEAIRQLAGGIAHDFNNVLGAILGWAELGKERATCVDNNLFVYFSKIHTQCDRATALVRQLLAFTRRQILEPRNLNLNQTVQDVLNMLDNMLGEDIELKTILQQDLPVIRADPTQIEQVLMNLCINSRDAMAKGGCLTVETHFVEYSEEECRHDAALEPGRFAELRVTDTGMGMDPEVRARIFEPFFTTRAPGKGTGLGLATVYGIVKQHCGFIRVESEPGQGCTFHIFLPVNEGPEKTDYTKAIIEDHPVRGGNETILIAEDHEGMREMAREALESLGYHILIARDGEEAVAVFSAHRDSISLVLLDVIMPRRNGPEACASIEALKSGVSVVFATGYADEGMAMAGIVERGFAVLKKPYSPRTLCRKVREVLDHAAAARLSRS